VPIDKPFSAASERNRAPILAVLQRHFGARRRVLEIGSGTGQHAVHFAAAMPWLTWQASDRVENLPGIGQWRDETPLSNLPPAIELDVARGPWPSRGFDAAFSANTVHILHWPEVEAMFAGLDRALATDATMLLYGPFHRDGRPTSDSNAAFDASLRARDPGMGVRDVEAVQALAASIGLRCVDDVAMPANNACLVWQRG
jgi:cyclopropane fatty-acyl-phospholipid synthase-like methyltransferase